MRAYHFATLAEVYRTTDQLEEGLHSVEQGLLVSEETGEGCFEAELHRLKGELLRSRFSDKAYEAEASFHQALNVARHQQARSWELRAATSLARLWKQQDKRQNAYNLLAPVYGWFTEGFDTADLQDAKTLLDELEG